MRELIVIWNLEFFKAIFMGLTGRSCGKGAWRRGSGEAGKRGSGEAGRRGSGEAGKRGGDWDENESTGN